MNYNRNYFSRKGRTFIPKPLDPGFTIDPSKVEAYKEYCLNNGLIKFSPPISPTIDGTMEVYDVQQSYSMPGSGSNHNLLDNIVFQYTGKSLIDFDYVLCTISGIAYNGYTTPIHVANINSGVVTGYKSANSGLSGYLVYQSETGNTAFIIPNIPTSRNSLVDISSPGFEYYLSNDSISVVIETLVVGKLPENQ